MNIDWISLGNQIIFYSIGYIMVILASGIVGRLVAKYDVKDSKSLPGAGKIIGILERILTITLVYVEEYRAIAFIIAAKSIIRFDRSGKNSGRRFAEYFLIGTFSSIIIAILIGNFILFFIKNVDIYSFLFDP